MSLNDLDYTRLADAIVKDYTAQGIPLRDSLVKVANEHSLNIHETQQLLHATNVKAHLALFKVASDHKYVEFDVLDPDDITRELFGRVDVPTSSPDGEKVAAYVAADHFLDLPDEVSVIAHTPLVKTAETVVDVAPVVNKYAGDRGYYAYSMANKVAEELRDRVHALHLQYSDAVEKIASEYKSIYAEDFAEFEKDAYALHGKDAEHVIIRVCDALHRTPTFQTKTAGHYPISRPVHVKLAHAVSLYKELSEMARGLLWYESRAEKLIHE